MAELEPWQDPEQEQPTATAARRRRACCEDCKETFRYSALEPTKEKPANKKFGYAAIAVLAVVIIAAAVVAVIMLTRKTTPDNLSIDSISVTRNIMVPMRDGVRLATDVYRPAHQDEALPGPYYALLVRTPYNKTDSALLLKYNARTYALNGYVVVYQDVRGRYNSEGNFTKYTGEGPDGYDTIAWVISQPWSNGKVGMFGTSYLAHTTMAAACLAPPGLAAMLLDEGGFSNAYQGGIRQGGTYELKQVTWAFKQARLSPEVLANKELQEKMDNITLQDWFNSEKMPWKVGSNPLEWTPDYDVYVADMWKQGTFNNYWKQVGIYAMGYYDVIPDIPMLHISSWYDPYTRTASDNYLGLNDKKKGPVQLVLGSWMHGAPAKAQSFSGDVDFGENATLDNNLGSPDFSTFRMRWFDHWLRGISNGEESIQPVRIFVMGGGSGRKNIAGRMLHGGYWRQESDWPLTDQEPTKFYLHIANALSTALPTDPNQAPLAYNYDPANPVPSIGGTITSGAPVMEGGAFNQVTGPRFFPSQPPYGPLADRPDVLRFETPVLTEEVEITGIVEAHLFIRSNCTDTDFTFKLLDVYPPNEDYPEGFAMNLNDGIMRVRYRDNTWANPQLMTPGQIYEIVVEPFPISNRFVAGHRIRVDISSSNFPHFDLNPNTGAPEGVGSGSVVAHNEVLIDSDHPSYVLLPLIRNGCEEPCFSQFFAK